MKRPSRTDQTPKSATLRGRPKENTRAQMLLAAKLFHMKGMTRQAIAAHMHIESRRVSTLLDEAREAGIVKIIIDETVESDYAPQIMRMFPHLKKVIIVQAAPFIQLQRSWGVAAAVYFDELVAESVRKRKPLHVGISGNETLLQFVDAVPETPRPNVYIHAIGLIGQGRLPKYTSTSLFSPQAVSTMLWSKTGRIPGHLEFATVSPYNSVKPGPEAMTIVRDELAKVEQNPAIEEVVRAMQKIDVVISGLGIVNPKGLSKEIRGRATMESLLQNIITPQQLAAKGAVGDYCYAPFTATGEPVPDCRFFITAGHYSPHKDIAFFRNLSATPGKRVVAFGGMPQLPAIRAALTGEVFNVFITDETTAKEIAAGS